MKRTWGSKSWMRGISLAVIGMCTLAAVFARIYARPTSVDVAGVHIPLPANLHVVAWKMPLLTESEYQYVVERVHETGHVGSSGSTSRFAITNMRTSELPRTRSVACRRLSFVDSSIASAGTCRVFVLDSKTDGVADILVAVDDLPCAITFEYWGRMAEFGEFSALMAESISTCARVARPRVGF